MRLGTLHESVAARARAAGSGPAVADASTIISYAELDARATRLAHRLRAAGVGLESRVAVVLPRSPSLVVALLGVLKAGAAYVPIDPDYPAERQRLMLDDCGALIVLTAEDDQDAYPGLSCLVVDRTGEEPLPDEALADLPEVAGPGSAAYVIYTSGTTGKPKGVVVEHRHVLQLLADPQLAIEPGSVVAQFAPTAFDASVFEIWGALCAGAQVTFLHGRRLSVAEIGAQLRHWEPDWMFLTTGLFHLIAAHDLEVLKAVDCLLTGGDVLSPEHVGAAAEGGPRRLYAAYGPTETTVFATLCPVTAPPRGPVPLGRPLHGRRVHVLDAELRPVPDGETGEIYLGGAGISRGYHARPALTAQRFVPDPFAEKPGARLYRTGDRGRILPGGDVEFHGRADRQVKVRGFRIEPEEIESLLRTHPDVDNAVVVARPAVDNDKRLVAYLLPVPGAEPPVTALRTWLQERLPAYAVPATLCVQKSFPLDPNGKTDVAALPDPWTSRAGLQGLGPYTAPRTDVERVIAAAWAEALDLDEVGIDDGFFELGGDSLRSVYLLERLRHSGITLSAATFFRARTVAALARAVGSGI